MKFDNLAKTWDAFGKQDPLWSILAWEGKENNNWDVDEFFEVGKGEVTYILKEAEKRKIIKSFSRSLDFGCGVGRLTFPLGDFFTESHGVDISNSMITKAKEFQQYKASKNCIFHLNKKTNLELFESDYFDFILSIIVLQHMESQYFLQYLKEFLRLLKKGGVLVFQLPDQTENRANYEEFEENTKPIMEMYGMSKDLVVKYLQEHGGSVLDVTEDESCGDALKSYRYFVSK